jgi:tetratricopeptide (TPR) repeat protein
MEPLLTSYAIGIATNAAIEAIVRLKVQSDELKEASAGALLERNEMFVEFESLLQPHIDEVFGQFEVAKELNDFLLSDSAREELSSEIRRQAAGNEWSQAAVISALTIPDNFGLMPQLEEFVDGLIGAVKRTIARDQIRWNLVIMTGVGKALADLTELKEGKDALLKGQADIHEKLTTTSEKLDRLAEQPREVNVAASFSQTNIFMGPSVPEWWSEELGTERDKRLDEIRDLLKRRKTREAEAELRELKNARSWKHVPTKIKMRALRMQAGLALGSRSDVGLGEALLTEANELDPGASSPFHQAFLLLHTGELDAALDEVASPSTLDEWHLRAAILINQGNLQEALDLLSNSAFESNAETFRLKAIAKLILREPFEAKRNADEALKASPEWFDVQETAGKVYYYSAIAKEAPDWGIWEAPPPAREEFVKVDPESQQAFQKAEVIFDHLSSTEGISERDRLEMNCWRLGCLFNMPERREAAVLLCKSMLEDDPLCFPVIAWAIEKRVEFDWKSTQTALEQAVSESPDIPRVQTLFSVLCSQGTYDKSGKLLDTFRHLYEKNSALATWKSQRIQIAVLNGETALCSEFLEEDPTGELKGLAARVKAKKNGWSPDALAELDQVFEKSQRPEDLFAACEAHMFGADFEYVIQHGDRLLEYFPTEVALRLVLSSAFHAGKSKTCLMLTEKHKGLLRGASFSGEMRRLRSRCLYLLGRFSEARDELRQIQAEEISTEDRFQLFDTQLKSGDPSGAIVTVRELLEAPDVTAGGLIHIADRVRAEDMHLARVAFRRAQEIGIDDPTTATQAVDVGFKLGEDHRLADVLRLATRDAGTPGAPMQAVSLEEIVGMMRDHRAAEEEREREYREGRIPVHLFSCMGENSLPFLFWTVPENCRKSQQPLSRNWSLRIQHGSVRKSRIRQTESPEGGMFLDVTALLLMHELGILEVVEKTIAPLLISSSALAWLEEEIAKTTGYQILREESKRLVASVTDAGRLQILDAEALESSDDSSVAVQMGNAWAGLAKQATEQNGLIVEFLPITRPGIDREVAELPDSIREIVCDAPGICNALHAAGKLSALAIAEISEKLGSRKEEQSPTEDIDHPREGSDESPSSPLDLQEGQTVVLQAGQLEQLAYAGALGPLAEFANIVVQKDEVDRIKAELAGYDLRRKVSDKLKELRQHLRLKLEDNTYREVSVEIDELPDLPESQKTLMRCFNDAVDIGRTKEIWTCIDDRMLGRFKKVGESQIVGTIDLLEFLEQRGALSRIARLDILHRLRSGNVRYLYTTAGEIVDQLGRAQIQNGAVRETAELTTLRRYFAACIADEASLQRIHPDDPKAKLLSEALFLLRQYSTVLEAIKAIWSNAELSEDAQIAQSDWLLESLWYDSVALPAFLTEFQNPADLVGLGLHQVFVIGFQLPGLLDDGGKAERFWRWLFSRIGREPRRWNNVLRDVKNGLFAMAQKSGAQQELVAFGAMQSRMIKVVPLNLRPVLSLSKEDLEVLGAKESQPVELGPHLFRSDLLWASCGKVLDGEDATIETEEPDKKRFKLSLEEIDAGDKGGEISVLFEPEDGGSGFRWSDGVLFLLQRDLEKLKISLQKLRSTLDLSQREASLVFAEILVLEKPGERIEVYARVESESFKVHLREIETHLGDKKNLSIEILRPRGVDTLLRHLRLQKGLSWDSLNDAFGGGAQTLIDEEGLQEAFSRFSSLPFPLPDCIRSSFSELEEKEREAFGLTPERVKSNPLLALHAASLLMGGDPNERTSALEILSGMSERSSFEYLDYFGHMLRWAYSSLCHDDSGGTDVLDYVIAAWVYSGRLQQVIGIPNEVGKVGEFFRVKTPTVSTAAFSPRIIKGDTRVHPQWFDAAGLQLGGISHLLPTENIDAEIAETIGDNLRSLCFPLEELPEYPALQLFQLGGTFLQETSSYLETESLSKLDRLPGLDHLAKIIEPARGEEIVRVLERLRTSPNDADSWLLLAGMVGMKGRSTLTTEQVGLLEEAIGGISFNELANSPNQLSGVGLGVFEFAQHPDVCGEQIDWFDLLESFGEVVLSRDFAGNSEQMLEVCINAAFSIGVSDDVDEASNVENFIQALTRMITKSSIDLGQLRKVLFRVASRQSSAASSPLWRLINELRER